MSSEALQRVRDFEAEFRRCADAERPLFHFTAPIGWLNDPNGFSLYKGEYHLFFQYHPFNTHWGPMHWGHAKSKDMIRWEYLPAALAPDAPYDRDGCFSGSAIELPDGRQLLLYTGIHNSRRADGVVDCLQQQCVAVGDGVDFEKLESNPVLDISDLPDGYSEIDFRDPKLWREGDKYYAVISSRPPDGSGSILLYESEDCFRWHFVTVLAMCRNEFGKMWECPDFFPLDGRQVLFVSPMQMMRDGLEFHAGYGNMAIIGDYDKTNHAFSRQRVQAVDYGLDFYAHQTLETPDGRRVMIAWMQNWATVQNQKENIRLFGQMTLPRELSIRDGRLYQNPVRELEQYRGKCTRYEKMRLNGTCTLEGVRGRVMDLTVNVSSCGDRLYQRFFLTVAHDRTHGAEIRYTPQDGVLRIERSASGGRFDIVHHRKFQTSGGGSVKLRIIMDRSCVELFVNDGAQAASFMLYDEEEADGVLFSADGNVMLDVEHYTLSI